MFKVPLNNVISITSNSISIIPFFVPTVISYILTLYIIPLCVILIFIENILIRYKKIAPLIKISFSESEKRISFILLFLAILAYLVSLGGWIHTMIPYSPEELENLRYD